MLSMSDGDLDDFYINNKSGRTKLFDAMKTDFNIYGPVSKQRTLEVINAIGLDSPARARTAYWLGGHPT
ncbi:hypothetical protein [Variovorax paradoxus]|uniref:Uncharacterized protein n=1 Tax=Variovorax paradoxus (strain EPS) TaxID=595537 RepID=E6UWF6_VARPE|nr:hypothetical protein Varpa_5734 [Variovorax paradoxus EPS]